MENRNRSSLFPGEAYVAFLDILGFKEVVMNNSIDLVAHLLCGVNERIESSEIALHYAVSLKADGPRNDKFQQFNRSLWKSRIISMSDSIVVVVPHYNQYSLAVMIDLCDYLQTELFTISKEPILLRGAIAKGEIYVNNGIVCGKALVEAYLAEENSSIYPRIIMSKDIYCSGRMVSKEDNYKVNIDNDGYYYIDSYSVCMDNPEIEKRLRNLIAKNMNGYSSTKVREKYLWIQRKLDDFNTYI